MHIDDHFINLIAKKLNGQASELELNELQDWIVKDPSHQREYDVYLNIWQQAGSEINAPLFNTSAAWSKMDNAISGVPVRRMAAVKRVVPMFLKKMAVAASIFALVAVGWLFYSNMRSREISIVAVSNQQISLPDGTEIDLRKGGRISYPGVFSSKSRDVQLSGEAYFKVHHDEHAPFHILTNHAEITVLGTSFLIRSFDNIDEVIVTNGKVSVADKNRVATPLLLTTGQQATLQNARMVKTLVSDSNFLAWKSGIMAFKNAPLTKVLADVANFYNLQLNTSTTSSEQIKQIAVTVRFDNQPMSQVLDELSLITGLSIRLEGGKLTCTAHP